MPSNCRATPKRLCSSVSGSPGSIGPARRAPARTGASRGPAGSAIRAAWPRQSPSRTARRTAASGRTQAGCGRPTGPRRSSTCRPRDAPDAEAILPWREVRVKDRPARPGLDPVGVHAVQPVAEARTVQPRQRQRREAQFQPWCLPAVWPARAPSAARWRWLPRCARPNTTAAPRALRDLPPSHRRRARARVRHFCPASR